MEIYLRKRIRGIIEMRCFCYIQALIIVNERIEAQVLKNLSTVVQEADSVIADCELVRGQVYDQVLHDVLICVQLKELPETLNRVRLVLHIGEQVIKLDENSL